MSDTEKNQAEKQVKIYLSVLVGLLIVAVMVTMFTFYRDQHQQQLAQNEESSGASESAPGQEAQIEKPEDTRPVEHNFADANSRIEKEESFSQEVPSTAKPQTSQPPKEPAGSTDGNGAVSPEEAAEPQNVTVAFDPDTDLMVWPVSGVVLMDYSPDTLIYDKTLDLYRTNDSLCIGAEEAEDVVAAASGVVTDIGESDTLGHYVVLDNGNGYETTYGQLSDEMLVELGETVAQGEAIGRIDAPSWYSSALGTHLTFTVKANGQTVNPLDYLENVLEDE